MNNELFKAIMKKERWACWRCDGLNQDGTFHYNFYVPLIGERTPAKEASQNALGNLRQAVKVVRSDMYFDGIAFLLAGHLPYVCITIEKCIKTSTGELNKTAAIILDRIHASGGGYRIANIHQRYKTSIQQTGGTYIELSHDEHSLSIWGLGEIPAGKKSRMPGVAIHKSGYIPVTGYIVTNSPLRDLQAVIDSLIDGAEPPRASPAEQEAEPGGKAGGVL